MSAPDRLLEIEQEHQARVATVGLAVANRELYEALARAERELEALQERVMSLVTVTDRRGPFLPPKVSG